MSKEFVFIGKSIVHGESSKAMGFLEDKSLIVKIMQELCSKLNFEPHLGIEK